MKIRNLTKDSRIYTCNVYLVLGTRNTLKDINTLVDVGRDPAIVEKINKASTGIGKRRVERVIISHGHYDHSGLIPLIKKYFNPVVYGFSPSLPGADRQLRDGQRLIMGDKIFEVIYAPGHSNDSICLFNEEEGVLFAGDLSLDTRSSFGKKGNYGEEYIRALERLCAKDVRAIYFGHGDPIMNGCNSLFRNTLQNIKA